MGKAIVVVIQIAIILLDLYIQKAGTLRQTSLLRRGLFIIVLMGAIRVLKKLSLRFL